jgi:uncharacterized membrane protein YccC
MSKKNEKGLSTRNRREVLFVDPKVQGMLLMRMVSYWFVVVFVIALLIGYQVYMAGPSQSIFVKLKQVLAHFEPALIAALCVLPFIMLDSLRVTSKFAGPLVRLRKEMRNLIDGKPVHRIKFRKNDLYDELTEEFNRLAQEVEALREREVRLTKSGNNVGLEEPATV